MDKKIKLLIIDDSALIRQIFQEILSDEDEIEVVGTARDAYDAREKIKQLNPDVVTLDIEMPKMDGISFLEKIMTLRPMPVIMISTLTQRGADVTIRALEMGAIDYISKPVSSQNRDNLSELKDEIIRKVKMAAGANVKQLTVVDRDRQNNVLSMPLGKRTRNLIAIGSSTGGVEAIKEVVCRLPADTPPIVIVQHMPPKFTSSFAARLNNICAMQVHEAVNDQEILPGNIYISPGSMHMKIVSKGSGYICKVFEGEKVSGHCPSVDVLFNSVAEAAGKKAVGVILTGMGRDGANGMLKMRNNGTINIGQNEASCVVYGMPKAAFENGAVEKEVALDKMAEEILKKCFC